MKKTRFTDSQVMAILKQNEAGASVPDLCREHGISSASVYKWRTKFGGMDALCVNLNPYTSCLVLSQRIYIFLNI